jgi:hypothetical protein
MTCPCGFEYANEAEFELYHDNERCGREVNFVDTPDSCPHASYCDCNEEG